jgi:hypothetical protein
MPWPSQIPLFICPFSFAPCITPSFHLPLFICLLRRADSEMSFQALVARLDAEIEGKLGLQRQLSALQDKVRHLESTLQGHSAPRERQPDNVESSVVVKVADFETERRKFDEARKVRILMLIQ